VLENKPDSRMSLEAITDLLKTSFEYISDYDTKKKAIEESICDGSPVLDKNGNVIANVVRYKDGNPILDQNGNAIPNVQRDADGNPIIGPDGKPVANVKFNEHGNVKVDDNGMPLQTVEIDESGNPF